MGQVDRRFAQRKRLRQRLALVSVQKRDVACGSLGPAQRQTQAVRLTASRSCGPVSVCRGRRKLDLPL